jgi:hypothetical protein
VTVDDVKCFDKFCNLKSFVGCVQYDEGFKLRRLVTSGSNTFRTTVMQTDIRVA